jgi:hypothetical protein
MPAKQLINDDLCGAKKYFSYYQNPCEKIENTD